MKQSAHGAPTPELDLLRLAFSLAGGVALFNFASQTVSKALRAAFGVHLREAIRAATSSRLKAFAVGTLATGVLTSATATTLLMLAFVSAGDMTFRQSLGLMLGINVGSTLNAHLMAFSLSKWGLGILGAGFWAASWLGGPAGKRPQLASCAEAVFGLGLLFTSLDLVSETMRPLHTHAPFVAFLHSLESPALALLVSAASAIAFQSSNTVIAIAIMLAQGGLLPLRVAVLFVFGSNVGSCITAVLAAIGKKRDTLRVAIAYLAFKAIGVLALLPLLTPFTALMQASTHFAASLAEEKALRDAVRAGSVFGAQDEGLSMEAVHETARRAVVPAQIANAHTAVNVFVALLFLPTLDYAAAVIRRLIPDDAGSDKRRSDAEEVEGVGAGGGRLPEGSGGSEGAGSSVSGSDGSSAGEGSSVGGHYHGGASGSSAAGRGSAFPL